MGYLTFGIEDDCRDLSFSGRLFARFWNEGLIPTLFFFFKKETKEKKAKAKEIEQG